MEGAGTILGKGKREATAGAAAPGPREVQKASPSGRPFRSLTSLQAISIEGPLKCKAPAGHLRRNLLVRNELLWGSAGPFEVTGVRTTATNNHLPSD